MTFWQCLTCVVTCWQHLAVSKNVHLSWRSPLQWSREQTVWALPLLLQQTFTDRLPIVILLKGKQRPFGTIREFRQKYAFLGIFAAFSKGYCLATAPPSEKESRSLILKNKMFSKVWHLKSRQPTCCPYKQNRINKLHCPLIQKNSFWWLCLRTKLLIKKINSEKFNFFLIG